MRASLLASALVGFHYPPMLIGNGELEDGFGQVDGHGSSMHVGLLWFEHLIPTPMKTSALISRKQTGESIPSVERTCAKTRAGCSLLR